MKGISFIPRGLGGSGFSGAWADLTGRPANVDSFGSLADASGVLTNNGAGAFNYTPLGSTYGYIPILAQLPSDSSNSALHITDFGGREYYISGDGSPGAGDVELTLPATGGQLALTSDIPSVAGYVHLSGDTLSGLIKFSGTTHAGIRTNNLTTNQKNALTPAAGMIIYDTSIGRIQSYEGSSWASHVRLAGDTMTGPLLIAAGSSAVSAPPLTVTQTWTGGSGVAYSGVKFTFTDTSSALSEEYFGVYGGAAGTTKLFSVEKIGGANIVSLGKIVSTSSTFSIDNDVNGIALGSARQISWSSTVTSYDAADVILKREAAGHLISRNGTTAQIFSISNTWTSTTNFERFKIDWAATSNVCRIGTSKGSGGGSARALHIEAGDVAAIKISTAGLLDFAASVANVDAAGVSTHSVPISVAGTIYNFLVRT